MKEEKENQIKEKVFLSEWIRIAREQNISFEEIISVLKEKFEVKIFEVEGQKILWLEKKGQKE